MKIATLTTSIRIFLGSAPLGASLSNSLGRAAIVRAALGCVSLWCASASSAFACGDPCASSSADDPTYFSRPDLTSGCSEDLPFLEIFNNSMGNMELLARAYANLPAIKPEETPTDVPWLSYNDSFTQFKEKYKVTLSPDLPVRSSTPYFYEPTACVSNVPSTAQAFLNALDGAPEISPEDKARLGLIRHYMLGICATYGDDTKVNPFIDEALAKPVVGPITEEFRSYLSAAAFLYRGNYERSLSLIESLQTASNSWIKETATYLRARLHLLQSQLHWDGYAQSNQSIDQGHVASGKSALLAYIKSYPSGIYVQSATDFLRRATYLEGAAPEYLKAVQRSLDEAIKTHDEGAITSLVAEIENRVQYDGEKIFVEDPIWAVSGLYQSIRTEAEAATIPKDIEKRVDNSQESYQRFPGLLPLTHALIAFGNKDFKKCASITATMPDTAPKEIQVAARVLRAQSLERAEQYAEAEPIWDDLLKTSNQDALTSRFQAALVSNFVRSKRYSLLATKGTSVTKMSVMEPVLWELIPADALRAINNDAASRSEVSALARRVLLAEALWGRDYPGFIALLEGAPSEVKAEFEPVETAVRTLNTDRKNPKALLNAGYFLQSWEIRPEKFQLSSDLIRIVKPDASYDEEIASPLERGTRTYDQPIAYYTEGLATFSGKTHDPIEAKLLYHAILCFKASTEGYACLGNSSSELFPTSKRKEWFNRLKSTYGDTEWAKKLKYYY